MHDSSDTKSGVYLRVAFMTVVVVYPEATISEDSYYKDCSVTEYISIRIKLLEVLHSFLYM